MHTFIAKHYVSMTDACKFLKKYRAPTTSFDPLWTSEFVSNESQSAQTSVTIHVGIRRPQYHAEDSIVLNRFPGLVNIDAICFVVSYLCLLFTYVVHHFCCTLIECHVSFTHETKVVSSSV